GSGDGAGGLSTLLGVELSRNFVFPFFASSPSVFWRRWHVTLTNWFRDYVYRWVRTLLPRRPPPIWALVPTMALVGLWHGARWSFVIWGLLWGLALLAEWYLNPTLDRIDARHP